MAERTKFDHPHFILAEGEEDAAFARELIAKRNISIKFDVSPNIDVGGTGGNSGFYDSSIASEPIIGFPDVKNVVILADNDDDPSASFKNVCDQIEKARSEGNLNRDWGKATSPGTKAAGDPSVSIWMWPSAGKKGCLETLFWQVVCAKYAKEAKCIDVACKCAGADVWPLSKLDKARFRCFVALVCKKNPAIGFGNFLRDFPALIPMTHRAFKPFSDFLGSI
jgi:hypothetical protein